MGTSWVRERDRRNHCCRGDLRGKLPTQRILTQAANRNKLFGATVLRAVSLVKMAASPEESTGPFFSPI